MFKKINIKKVRIIDDNNKVIFDGKLTNLPLREDLILEKCIEYFDDKSPCYIHRSAAMKRIFLQLQNYFEDNKSKGSWEWEELTDEVKYMIRQDGKSIKNVRYKND